MPDPAEIADYRDWLAEHPGARCIVEDECSRTQRKLCRYKICESELKGEKAKMRVDIDLSEIFTEGDGDIQESVKDAIIESVNEKIFRAIEQQVNRRIAELIEKEIKDRVSAHLDVIIPELMDYEFTETTRYGEATGTTTVKNRILSDIEKSMIWKDGAYDSDRSPYTKALKQVVQEKLLGFAKEFSKQIDSQFVAECIGYAQKKLQERMGIK
jgi:hypothetical protein